MNRVSPKRAAEIKAGAKMSGTFKVDLTALQARGGTMSEKTKDALFGKAKGRKTGHDARRIAKKRAWDQFSMFIRLRDSDEHGIATCCTCPARKHWRLMDAGHYVTTAKEATKFDENNVHAQCKGCNKWQGGRPTEYELFLERRYGPGTFAAIKLKAVRECKRDLTDYLFIEQTYRLRVDLIRTKEPARYFKAA